MEEKKPKEIERKLDEYPLMDGTEYDEESDINDNELKKNYKEVNKFVKDQEKVVDKINNFKEKLILPEEGEDLEEALPRPLGRAFRKSDYKKIRSRKPSYRTIDFDKSEYTEITPEEAIALKKEGRADEVIAVFDGQTVTFDNIGKHQTYRAEKNWKSDYPEKYRRPNGDDISKSNKLTYNTVMANAEKIFLANEKPYDNLDYDERGGVYDSPRYSDDPEYFKTSSYGPGPDVEKRGYISYDLNDTWVKESNYRDIKVYENRIEELKLDVEKLYDQLQDEETKDDGSRFVINSINHQIDSCNERINNYRSRIETAKAKIKKYDNGLQDYKAKARYIDSEKDLQSNINTFNEQKKAVEKLTADLDSLNDKLVDVKTKGTPENKRNIDLYNEYIGRIKDLNNKLIKLELLINMGSDIDNSAIIKITDEIADVQNKINGANAIKDRILRRTGSMAIDFGESLELPEVGCIGQKLILNESVGDDLEDYKPSEDAANVWEKIVNADMEKELYSLIEELYPEGITYEQLDDILYYDPDFILGELGLE